MREYNKEIISVIIVNYNTKVFLKKCINNLIKTNLNLQIIVVDNGSVDGSVKMVSKEFKNKVTLIPYENKGISVAYNLGAKQAKGDYLLFLGTDAFPKKDDLIKLLQIHKQKPNVGIITPQLVLQNGKTDVDCHRGFPTPWVAFTHFSKAEKLFPKTRVFGGYFLGYKDLNTTHKIDMCISHFMLVKTKVFKKVGGFDEEFFVFGEDVDFCYRVKQQGFTVLYVGEVKVKHLKGVSVGRKTAVNAKKVSSKTKKNMQNWSTKAMTLFYSKHYSKIYPKFITALIMFGINFLSFVRSKSLR